MAHSRDSLTPRRINTLLFSESETEREFSGLDSDIATNNQGISETIDDNPDDPQPITSGVASVASVASVDSVAIPDPQPSTSGVASVATDPQPSTSGVASVTTQRQLRKRKLSFSMHYGNDDSESDISDDDEIDFMPIDDSSSESDYHYSPVKRTYGRHYLRSGSVPYAVRGKGRGRSRSKTPATDSDSDYEGEYAGMEEEVVGGTVPGPRGAVCGQTKDQPPPSQPCAGPTPVPTPAPPRPMPQVHPAPSDREWNWTEHTPFVPHPFNFDGSGSGIMPHCPITNESTELDYFQLYFDEPIMNLIVTQTNMYYQYTMDHTDVTESSRLLRWKDTTVAEMYLFLGTIMLMPHTYKSNIAQYWSTDHFISTPVFRDLLPCNRFLLLLRMLHFSDRNTPNRNDLLYKIRELFMYLKQKFSAYFYPFKNIVVDESLILFKGRLSFKQYIPSKRNRFGIKMFVMCDCETGLVLDVIIYTGKNTLDDTRRMLGISGDVVRKMMQPYLGKGHTLYTDNWYTSPMLADFLRVNNTDICGTVRRNRKHMPKFTAGSVVQAFHANDIMALTWHDKRDVTLLSTIHRNEMVQTDRLSRLNNDPVEKPTAVVDYTKNMRLVDKCDMMIGFVDCVRRSRKWYIKVFFHLVDIAMLNAFNMFEIKTGKRQRYAEFTLNVIKQIARKYGTTPIPATPQRPVTPQTRPVTPQPEGEVPNRIIPNCHCLIPLPSTPKKKYSQKKCVVCANTKQRPQVRRDTRYMCQQCGVALCITPCFFEYHTVVDF